MSIKRYKVEHQWHDHNVTLEVDHDTLTPERAELFLRFWTSGADNISDEDGDAVRAAIRSFGATAIREMLSEYGATFTGAFNANIWSKKIRDIEGHGGENDTPHGWIGIRIVKADVDDIGFDDVAIKEIEA